MTDKEKIAKTIELLDSLGLEHEIMTIDDVREDLWHETLESVAFMLMEIVEAAKEPTAEEEQGGKE